MTDPTLNKTQGKQVFKGVLLKSNNSKILELPFKYEVVTMRNYISSMAGMPLEYTKPTETIRTTAIDLPFTRGDRIRLSDGNVMILQSLEPFYNIAKAQMGLPDCVEKYTLTLEGGGK